MILAAVFISPGQLEHIFGKDHPGLTLNFGGKYLYEIAEKKTKGWKVQNKKANPSYVPGFWKGNIEIMSAIVGENGIGKTSFLNLFRLPYLSCCFVIEDDDNFYLEIDTYKWDVLYYSPFLNQQMFGAEHENFRDYSKYSMMVDDTEYESMSIGSLMELHASENLKRWINFAKLKTVNGLLNEMALPQFDKVKLRINSFDITDHQTSYAFRSFFTEIERKLEAERERREEQQIKLHGLSLSDLKEDRSFGNEIRLELQIVKAVMNKVRNIFESTGNKYLGEGEFRNNFSLESPQFAGEESSKRAFYSFLDHAVIKMRNGKEIQIPSLKIKQLIERLISYIPDTKEIENTDEMQLAFDSAIDIMDCYESFLLSFKDDFVYDKKILLQFSPLRRMSNGESGLYDIFSALFEASRRFQLGIHKDLGDFHKRSNVSDSFLILLDEGDMGFHPEWKKKYVNALVEIMPFLFPGKKIQIIITTHDPLTLSDFPRDNVIYLKREAEFTNIFPSANMSSFGANISTLMKHSFFVKNGLIGDFAKEKIDHVIKRLNEWITQKNEDQKFKLPEAEGAEIRKVIELIDEPIIQQKLIEMYGLASSDDELSVRIKMMELELEQLKKKRESEK